MLRFYNGPMDASLVSVSLPALQSFAISLAIGLLIGLERERHVETKAGLRTFALVGLLGSLLAALSEKTDNPWLLASGVLIIGAMMIAASTADPADDGDPGTTSVVALVLCYALGAMVWYGFAAVAVMLAIAITALLYFKAELHDLSHSLTRTDLLSILQFGVLSFIVLPILPDQDYGPYGALNPRNIWWMLVLISGISLAGYAALRLIGNRHGAVLLGFFGGLVSSTATTMIFCRRARSDASIAATAATVILLANLVVLVRLTLVAAVIAPGLLAPLSTVFVSGLIAGGGVILWHWQRISPKNAMTAPDVSNPMELKAAFSFTALYAVVLVVSTALQDFAGSRGLYLVALASGVTDVDAISLSTFRLFNSDVLPVPVAATAVTLAVLANLAFKATLTLTIGGTDLFRRTAPAFVAMGAGLAAGLWLAVTFTLP